MPETARRWVIEGRVQGVGFRWFVHREAPRLDVRGWVRNLDDSRVEVVAVGTETALTSLDELVRQGPPGARVSRVTTSEVPHETVDIKAFEIRQ